MKVVLIFGSRPTRDYPELDAWMRSKTLKLVRRLTKRYGPLGWVLVAGGARGVDLWAEGEARLLGVHVARVDALWDDYGRSAGRKRNAALLALRPHKAYAIWDGASPGTESTIDLCLAGSVRLKVAENMEPFRLLRSA